MFVCLYDQSLSDTRTTFLLRVNDSLSFVDEWLVRQGLQKLIFVTLPQVPFFCFLVLLISLHGRFTDTTARLRTLILKHLATESVANNLKYLYGTLLCYSKTLYNIVRMLALFRK